MDSDSNTTIFCERKYVTEVWNVKECMEVGTNGNGQLVSNQRCMILNLGEHWFNKNSMTNIVALKDMTDRYRVTMDSEKEMEMFVHMLDKIVVFKQLDNNLYGMDPTDPTSYITTKKYEGKKV